MENNKGLNYDVLKERINQLENNQDSFVKEIAKLREDFEANDSDRLTEIGEIAAAQDQMWDILKKALENGEVLEKKECPDCSEEMIVDKGVWWCETCGHLPMKASGGEKTVVLRSKPKLLNPIGNSCKNELSYNNSTDSKPPEPKIIRCGIEKLIRQVEKEEGKILAKREDLKRWRDLFDAYDADKEVDYIEEEYNIK